MKSSYHLPAFPWSLHAAAGAPLSRAALCTSLWLCPPSSDPRVFLADPTMQSHISSAFLHCSLKRHFRHCPLLVFISGTEKTVTITNLCSTKSCSLNLQCAACAEGLLTQACCLEDSEGRASKLLWTNLSLEGKRVKNLWSVFWKTLRCSACGRDVSKLLICCCVF